MRERIPRRKKLPTSAADYGYFMERYHTTIRRTPLLVNPKSDNHSFFVSTLAGIADSSLKSRKQPSVLITGAADGKMLETVVESFQRANCSKNAAITLIDVHDQPLKINTDWHSWGDKPFRLRFIKCAARQLNRRVLEKRYDAVVTDAFLTFFSQNDKAIVMKEWNRSLIPGGKVITTVAYKLPPTALTPEQLAELKGKYNLEKRRAWGYSSESASRELTEYTRAEIALENYGALGPFESIGQIAQFARRAGFEYDIVRSPNDSPLGFKIDPFRKEAWVRLILTKFVDWKKADHR